MNVRLTLLLVIASAILLLLAAPAYVGAKARLSRHPSTRDAIDPGFKACENDSDHFLPRSSKRAFPDLSSVS